MNPPPFTTRCRKAISNCPHVAEPDQADDDDDGAGNACDDDDDGAGNACDDDDDGDGIADAMDPCPLDPTPACEGDGGTGGSGGDAAEPAASGACAAAPRGPGAAAGLPLLTALVALAVGTARRRRPRTRQDPLTRS
jgi:hypothetical protein